MKDTEIYDQTLIPYWNFLDVLDYPLVNLRNAARGLVHLVRAMLILPSWYLRF